MQSISDITMLAAFVALWLGGIYFMTEVLEDDIGAGLVAICGGLFILGTIRNDDFGFSIDRFLWAVLFFAILQGINVLISISCRNWLIPIHLRMETAWANVGVAKSKRTKLISEMEKLVREYSKNESEIHSEAGKGSGASTIIDFRSWGERYPRLKSNKSYETLLQQLNTSMTEVQGRMEQYNSAAQDYNEAVTTVPNGWFVKKYGYQAAALISVDE